MAGYTTTVHKSTQATARSKKQRKVSKVMQYLYRCIPPVQRTGANSQQVQQAIQGVKITWLLTVGYITKQQAQHAKALAFTGKKAKPQTNRFTPKYSPTGNVRRGFTAIGYAMVSYSVTTKNTQGRYVTTPLQAKATVTGANPNGTYSGVIPQRNNSPAQVITISPPNHAFNTGYTLLYWLT